MKRITKESWFAPRSKELKWTKREAPLTWQGWAIIIVFYSIYFTLFVFYIINFYSSEWRFFIILSLWGTYIILRLVVTLTSDNPFWGRVDSQHTSEVSTAEIRRKLNEKRKNLD